MRGIRGGRGGPPPGPQDGIAVRPLGDLGDPHRAQLAAKMLAEMVGILASRGTRPQAGLLALTYPDGSMTFLVAANSDEQAGQVQGRVYEALHNMVEAYMEQTAKLGAPGPTGASAPAPQDDEVSSGPESSDP